jgi:arylsulfatase A-like enzyme
MKRLFPVVGLALCLAGTVSVFSCLGAGQSPKPGRPAARPNIIVIVADDLGYGDLGCQGGRDIPTPNIDSLARNGVRFSNGYVSCPVCSPTRAGLMTGRYQQRFGHEFNPGAPAQAGAEFGLPLTERTLADFLQAAGYVTGMVGKWHLGLKPQFHPLKRGFSEYFGFLHGAHSYINAKADPQNLILRGAEPVDEKEYLTEAFTREALAFLERHHQGPFFLYLTYNAVHAPLQAPEKYLSRFSQITDPKRRTYAAMLSAMDDGVGAVLKKLRDSGAEDNTLIFFISDNGGPTQNNGSSNAPLRGNKAQLWEGGIRVPFLIQWKQRLAAGLVYDQPVIALDILPTALAAAGIATPKTPPLDGVNLLPFVTGKSKRPPHEALYWRFGTNSAIRLGDYKLLKLGARPLQLFDLQADVGERHDLAPQKPEVVKALAAKLKAWDAQLATPRWGGAPARAAQRAARPRGNR